MPALAFLPTAPQPQCSGHKASLEWNGVSWQTRADAQRPGLKSQPGCVSSLNDPEACSSASTSLSLEEGSVKGRAYTLSVVDPHKITAETWLLVVPHIAPLGSWAAALGTVCPEYTDFFHLGFEQPAQSSFPLSPPRPFASLFPWHPLHLPYPSSHFF